MAKPSNITQAQEFFRAYNDALREMGVGGKQFELVMGKIGEQILNQTKMSEKSLDNFKAMVEEAGAVFAEQENIGDEKQKQLTIDKQLFAKHKDILKVVQDEQTTQAEITKTVIDQKNKTNNAYNRIHDFLKNIPVIGTTIAAQFGMVEPYVDKYNEFFKEGLAKAGKKSGPGLKKFGVGLSSAMKVGGLALLGGLTAAAKSAFSTMTEMGLSFNQTMGLGINMFMREELKAVTAEFGTINDSTSALSLRMKWFSFFTKTSSTDLAKITGMMAATSGLSNEALFAQIETTKQLAQQEGIKIDDLMSDVASNAEYFAEFSKDGGQNIMNAAMQAKKLGVNLATVASIADSLLDFETSIEKQMEAQVLLGRNLNLDRARQLAFTGKHTEMMQEVLRQVGGEAAFNRMSRFERKALAAALGQSADTMARLIRQERSSPTVAAATASIGGASRISPIAARPAGGVTNVQVRGGDMGLLERLLRKLIGITEEGNNKTYNRLADIGTS